MLMPMNSTATAATNPNQKSKFERERDVPNEVQMLDQPRVEPRLLCVPQVRVADEDQVTGAQENRVGEHGE